MWGYNSLLTGAALGGNLLVLNGQTAAAAIMGIIYTPLLQYTVESIFAKVTEASLPFCSIDSQCLPWTFNILLIFQTQLPVLTLPFVTVTSLFLKLSDGTKDPTFPWPVSITFPEKQRHHYLARCAAFREVRISPDFTCSLGRPSSFI